MRQRSTPLGTPGRGLGRRPLQSLERFDRLIAFPFGTSQPRLGAGQFAAQQDEIGVVAVQGGMTPMATAIQPGCAGTGVQLVGQFGT